MSRKVKILLVGLLTALVFVALLPEYARARKVAHMNSCINHLAQIDGAKQQWAKKNNVTANDIPTWDDLQPYLGRGSNLTDLVCPDGGVYTIGRVADAPKCSIRGHYLN